MGAPKGVWDCFPFKGALLFFAGVLRSNTQVWLSVQQWEGWSDVGNRKWA